MKECLILETGEKFLVFSDPNTGEMLQSSAVDEGKPQSVYMVQSGGNKNPSIVEKSIEEKESIDFQIDPDTARDRTSDDNNWRRRTSDDDDNWRRCPDPDTYPLKSVPHDIKYTNERLMWMDQSEAFSYMSLEDNHDGEHPQVHLTEGQQGYITNNGIPIILDNAEDDTKLSLQGQYGGFSTNQGVPLSLLARLHSSRTYEDVDHGDSFFGGEQSVCLLRVCG